MACLSVQEYAEERLVLFPMGNLLIEDGVVRVLDFGLGDYRPPSVEEAAEIAEALRNWAEQIETSAEDARWPFV